MANVYLPYQQVGTGDAWTSCSGVVGGAGGGSDGTGATWTTTTTAVQGITIVPGGIGSFSQIPIGIIPKPPETFFPEEQKCVDKPLFTLEEIEEAKDLIEELTEH